MHARPERSARRPPRIAVAVLSAVAIALVGALVPAAASAAPKWAPAGEATIRPGAMTDTEGGGCTSNFVFFKGTDVFLGQAAHCAGTGAETDTNGCTSGTKPLGTQVKVTGASRPGTMVYSSWITMQQRKEADPNACAGNDLALIKLDPADAKGVNPSVPFFGGPVALDTTGTALFDRVVSYGNSKLRGGITQLSPKVGISLGDDTGGWNHTVYTLTPGIPGDSGSALLSNDGKALGVLSVITILPLAGSNGFGDLSRELGYLNSFGPLGTVALALGTEPFHAVLP